MRKWYTAITLQYIYDYKIPHPQHIRTWWKETKLPAGHISISSIPEVITHSGPQEVTADLNSTFKIILPVLESDITVRTQS